MNLGLKIWPSHPLSLHSIGKTKPMELPPQVFTHLCDVACPLVMVKMTSEIYTYPVATRVSCARSDSFL